MDGAGFVLTWVVVCENMGEDTKKGHKTELLSSILWRIEKKEVFVVRAQLSLNPRHHHDWTTCTCVFGVFPVCSCAWMVVYTSMRVLSCFDVFLSIVRRLLCDRTQYRRCRDTSSRFGLCWPRSEVLSFCYCKGSRWVKKDLS